MEYSTQRFASSTIEYQENLKVYMLQVYFYMTAALILTGLMAILPDSSQTVMNILYIVENGKILRFSNIGWIINIIPIMISLAFSLGLPIMNVVVAQILFWSFSLLLGLSLSSIVFIYSGENITSIFFLTAAIFGMMSIYGYTTRKDLTSLGSFLLMALIGIIIASLINIFLKSSNLKFVLSIISVLIFTGHTAFDTQRIREVYLYRTVNNDTTAKIAIYGALTLYLDFINIFLHLLQLFGKKKEE